MKKLLLFSFFVLNLLPALGQNINSDTLVGKVVNVSGKPISQARITVLGSKNTTKTNSTGAFQLIDVNLNDTLAVTVKKNTATLPIKGKKYITIKMISETQIETEELGKDELSKLIRQLRRVRNTSSTVILTGEELRETGETNILNALAGKVPGLTVVIKDNGTVSAKIRGGSSMNLDDSPLYLLDEVETDRLDIVNINDVKRVEVYKDSNFYGVKGANGVIKVFTK